MNERTQSLLADRDRVKVSPSVLAADFGCLASDVRAAVEAGADCLHLDVMDGHFVPNLTIGPDMVAAVRRATDAIIDCHLMITHPLDYVKAFAEAGADILYFHVEAESDGRAVIEAIRSLDVAVGVTLNPETPVAAVEPYLDGVDLVLVMTVHPGFGGQSFMASELPKVDAIVKGWNLPVALDGGVGAANAELCGEAGAEILVAGTAVFRAPDYGEAIRAIREAAVQGRARRG